MSDSCRGDAHASPNGKSPFSKRGDLGGLSLNIKNEISKRKMTNQNVKSWRGI
jgi:hypothetical protein